MKKTIEKLQAFEKRNNVSALINLYADGSSSVREFYDGEYFFWAVDEEQLHEYLERAIYKKSECGRMISPAKLVCSACRSENPCSGLNNDGICFLIDEQNKFLNDEIEELEKEKGMKTEKTIVLGVNDEGKIVFSKTFDYNMKKSQKKAWETFEYAQENFYTCSIGDANTVLSTIDDLLFKRPTLRLNPILESLFIN